MKSKLVITYLIVSLLAFTSLQASNTDKVGTLEERVKEVTLDNGLKVVVVERHNAPVFFGVITFRVGSSNELPNRSGLSHFLEHMLFKGTKTIGSKGYENEIPIMKELEEAAARIKEIQIDLKSWRYELFDEFATKVKSELPAETREAIGADEAAGWRAVLDQLPEDVASLPEDWTRSPWMLENKGHDYWAMYRELLKNRAHLAELIIKHREFINQTEVSRVYNTHGGRALNAATSYDFTRYQVGLPANCLELWMSIEADRYQNPVFREFYSEREVIMEEKRMKDNNPGGKLFHALVSAAFNAHPYGIPIIGWMSDIKLTTRSDMENHFNRYYVPNNCQIAIVGDVNADEVFTMVEKYYGSWEAKEVNIEVTIVEPEQIGERRVQVEHDAEPQLIIGYHVPTEPHPDAYPLEILMRVLSEGRTSRLYKSVFVEQGLTSRSPGVDTNPADRYPNLMSIFTAPKSPHTTLEVEEAVYAEFEKLKVEPVTDRELERIRNNFKMEQLERMSSNYWLAFTMSYSYANRGDWRALTEDFNRLMQVTPKDIQRVAKKYLTAQNRTVATLVKPVETVNAEVEAKEGLK